MGLGDLWNRTLVYFGIAEEDDDFYEDEDGYAAEESLEQSYRERPNVRRLTPRRRAEYDDWTESEPTHAPRQAVRVASRPRAVESVPAPSRIALLALGLGPPECHAGPSIG
jgi:cell division inhibitor SepF